MTGALQVYVGTYTETIRFGTGQSLHGKGAGIYHLELDLPSGTLRLIDVTHNVANASYLAFDVSQRLLYAVNELKSYQGHPSGTVSAFAVDPATGALTFRHRQLTHGTDPCHLAVDDSRHLFVTNFMSGSICVLPVAADGSIGPASDFIPHFGSGIDPVRQAGPHPHSVTLDPSQRFAFVPDLGLDKVLIYRVDAARGMLEPNAVPWFKLKPGSGPRHLALHPNRRFAYLANELSSTVVALACDQATGALQELQTISSLPAKCATDNTCADIQVHPSGRFLYASNRGHDSVAMFAIDASGGRLAPIGHTATQGRTPRNFCVDPTGRFLLVVNQDSDSLVAFAIDASTGALCPTDQRIIVPTPACIRIRGAAPTSPHGGPSWRR